MVDFGALFKDAQDAAKAGFQQVTENAGEKLRTTVLDKFLGTSSGKKIIDPLIEERKKTYLMYGGATAAALVVAYLIFKRR